MTTNQLQEKFNNFDKNSIETWAYSLMCLGLDCYLQQHKENITKHKNTITKRNSLITDLRGQVKREYKKGAYEGLKYAYKVANFYGGAYQDTIKSLKAHLENENLKP